MRNAGAGRRRSGEEDRDGERWEREGISLPVPLAVEGWEGYGE